MTSVTGYKDFGIMTWLPRKGLIRFSLFTTFRSRSAQAPVAFIITGAFKLIEPELSLSSMLTPETFPSVNNRSSTLV